MELGGTLNHRLASANGLMSGPQVGVPAASRGSIRQRLRSQTTRGAGCGRAIRDPHRISLDDQRQCDLPEDQDLPWIQGSLLDPSIPNPDPAGRTKVTNPDLTVALPDHNLSMATRHPGMGKMNPIGGIGSRNVHARRQFMVYRGIQCPKQNSRHPCFFGPNATFQQASSSLRERGGIRTERPPPYRSH